MAIFYKPTATVFEIVRKKQKKTIWKPSHEPSDMTKCSGWKHSAFRAMLSLSRNTSTSTTFWVSWFPVSGSSFATGLTFKSFLAIS